VFFKYWLLVLNSIEEIFFFCSKSDATFKVVQINFSSKFGAWVGIAILQPWKFKENLGWTVVAIPFWSVLYFMSLW